MASKKSTKSSLAVMPILGSELQTDLLLQYSSLGTGQEIREHVLAANGQEGTKRQKENKILSG